MGQNGLEDDYKDSDVVPKVNKTDMAGMTEAIKEYLRSPHGIIRAPLVYIITKTIAVQNYGDYPKYVAPDDEMIAKMSHLPLNKKKVHNEKSAQTVKEHMGEYEINNKSVYDILDQDCKVNVLYPNVKQHKSKMDSRGAFYAIYSRWLGPIHVNITGSKTKLAFQMLTYSDEKNAWK